MRTVSDQSWWITNDGFRVSEGDPEAAFLLVGAGCLVDEADLERYPLKPPKETKEINRPPETKEARRR